MKLPTSNKTSASYKKPQIRKGYYPGKLLKVEPFVDADGNLKEGKHGHQLIMEFAIYAFGEDMKTPTKPILFEEKPVKLSKFVYYEYKDKKTGEYRTAITPNSAITKTLTNLGWTFSTEDVDLEKFVGKFAEVNVDDYEYEDDGEKKKASSIAGINKYEGSEIPEDLEEVEATKKSQEVKKEVKHEDIKESEANRVPIEESETSKIKAKIAELEQMNKDGFLTDEGLAQAKEQYEARLKELE